MDDPSQQAPIEDDANLMDMHSETMNVEEDDTQEETRQHEVGADETEEQPEMSKVVENLTVAALREVCSIAF